MEGKEPESKYLVMWICVIIAAGIIFTGWIFAMKYNFGQINDKMGRDVNKTADQASQEVEGMFAGIESILNKADSDMKLEVNVVAPVEKAPATEVPPAVVPAQE